MFCIRGWVSANGVTVIVEGGRRDTDLLAVAEMWGGQSFPEGANRQAPDEL